MARPSQDPPLNTRVEMLASTSEVERWRAVAGDVPLAAWARRVLSEAAREIAYDEACPKQLLVLGRCRGTDRTGAAVMLTPTWNAKGNAGPNGHRALDLFLSQEQAERLIADLQAALSRPPPEPLDRRHPAHPDWRPGSDAPTIPGWARWPGRRGTC